MTPYWLTMKYLLAILLVLALGLALFLLRPSGLDGARAVEPSAAEVGAHGAESAVLMGDLEERSEPRREGAVVAAGGEEDAGAVALESGLWVRGRVVCAGPEKVGVAGAEVRFDLSGDAGSVFRGAARSDAEGRFAIQLGAMPDSPPSARPNFDARVSARAKGFQPNAFRVDAGAAMLGKVSVEVVLRAGPVLFGSVQAPSGAPAADAFVVIDSVDAKGRVSHGSGGTNEDGVFVVARRPGTVTGLEITAKGFERKLVVLGPDDVPEDGDLGVMQLEAGWPLAGHLRCPHGEPLAGVELRVRSVEDSALALTSFGSRGTVDVVTDAGGGFSVTGLSFGSYRIEVDRERLGTFEVGQTDLRLVSKQALVVARVVDEEGRGLPGLSILFEAGMVVDGEFEADESTSTVTEAPLGESRLQVLNSRWDRVVVSCSSLDGRWAEGTVELVPGVCVHEVELVLPSKMPRGTVRLDVTDAAGGIVTDARLALWPLDHAEGVLELRGPGPHGVLAGQYEGRLVGTGLYELPVELASLFVAAGGETVVEERLGLGGRIALEVEVDRQAWVEEPIGETGDHWVWRLHARARLKADGAGWQNVQFRNEVGTRRFTRLEPGERGLLDSVLEPGVYQIEVSAEGYETFVESVVVIAGKTSDKAARLRLGE